MRTMKTILFKKYPGPSEEEKNLRREIERSKTAIEAARNHFEQVVDPTLIDCYIYQLNSEQKRYKYLLQKAKESEIESVVETVYS